jgi:predicted Zn-dependent protease
MLARLGEDEIALQAWEEHDRREPEQATTLFEMAYLMHRMGYPPTAVLSRMKKAIALEPSNTFYQAQYAILHIAAGQPELGRAILVDLLPERIDCPHLATRIARGLEDLQRVDRATRWWRRSIELARDPGYQPED